MGYVSTLTMYPLDFEEFSWACGIAESTFAYLVDCLAEKKPVDSVVNRRMEQLFRRYLLVGGMPDVINAFTETNDLSIVRDIQESVRDWYRTDITKYCPVERRLKAKEAFDLIPAELNNPNKRFILKNLNENARFRNYEDAFLWLSYANVALATYNVEEPSAPPLLSKQRNLFKLFQSDVGILSSTLSRKTAFDLLEGDGSVNHGSVYENAVAQELAAHGFNLYYFNSKKFGELDFVIETRDGEVLPIEVKSGKGYRRHRALNNVLEVENYHLERGYVLGADNIAEMGRVIYLPIYMIAAFVNE